MALLASALEARQRCDVVAVTPAAGRTAVLWIGRTDRLIHRIDVPLSERVETIRYADYRRVGDAALPFSIAVDDGDEAATARIAVSSYRFLSHVRAAAVRPPPQNFTDSRIKDGLIARSSLSIDRGTGFPIVFAAVDGRKPMPFIVDTGGHDILTPIATRHLGLKTVGQGVSFGAGSGSTPTTFTSVRKIAIGRAEMLAQPFTVLDLDLGKVSDSNGRKIPIAGILGLEFFERFTVSLNFPLREVTLRLRSNRRPSGGTVVPLTFTSDVPIVDARLDRRSGSFSLDTGNNVGLIVYHRWLLASGVRIRAMRGGMGGSSVGGMVMFRRAYAESFVLGAIPIDGVPILIADAHSGSMSSRSEAGNIGVALLSRFCVTLDVATGTMVIRR